MKKVFIATYDDVRGYLGLLEEGAPAEFEPIGAMGVAHDCLEHFPNPDGSIDDEFMALGAMLWVRGYGGYDFGFGTPGQAAANEMMATLWRAFEDGISMRPPKAKKKELDCWVDDAITDAKHKIKIEYEDVNKRDLRDFLASAEYWLQEGFNRAQRRYKQAWRACYVFQQIQEAVEKQMKWMEEGDKFIVQYCVSKEQVRVWKEEPEYEDWY